MKYCTLKRSAMFRNKRLMYTNALPIENINFYKIKMLNRTWIKNGQINEYY